MSLATSHKNSPDYRVGMAAAAGKGPAFANLQSKNGAQCSRCGSDRFDAGGTCTVCKTGNAEPTAGKLIPSSPA